MTIKSAELPNNVTLPYVEQGEKSGVPVLFLHGVTDSLHSFDLVLPHLPHSIRAIALTQRGHGDASRPASGYRYTDFASDLNAFMGELKIASAVIVGHSMGSAVAQRFAIDYPERTGGLVLVAAFANLRGNPGVQWLWDTAVSTMTDPVDPGFVREFQESTVAKPVPKEFFETAVRESLKVPAHVWRAAFDGFLQNDFSDERSKIAARTLIVWGDQDTFCTRSDQEKLMVAIPDAALLTYAGVGHAVHWEEPGRFASDLGTFVEALVSDQRI